MKQYAIIVTSVFNNGKDYRTERCRNRLDAKRKARHYKNDETVLSVEIIRG